MFQQVTRSFFNNKLATLRSTGERIKINLVDCVPMGVRCYLSLDSKAGFGIKDDGEIIAVFSNSKVATGKLCLEYAKQQGGVHLNCFSGWLVGFYKGLGFKEVNRKPNWTNGHPDVVFMALSA